MSTDGQLVVDTNILLRCSLGKAMSLVSALTKAGVLLATTEHNAREMRAVLERRFLVPADVAQAEADQVLAFFDILPAIAYGSHRVEAARRLRPGGAADWPALAAAMAHGIGVWTEDVDFFGTGVPTWTSANVLRFVSPLQD